MNCSTTNNNHTIRGAWVLCASILFTLGACTEVDDRLGGDLVPKNQHMEIEVTSPAAGVKTYLFREDSLPSSRTGSAWFGRTFDSKGIFGAETRGAVLQFMPSSRPYDEAEGYGIDPIVDSAVIMFALNGVRGDTTVVQRFDVWEISADQPKLSRDSVYYTNFPVERYKGRRLFEFSHNGRRDVATKLFPTAAGKEYLDKIVTLPWNEYVSDSLFLEKFRGLYIAPADDSPAAALYGADLTASGIGLYVRNHDTLDTSAIYDTLLTTFLFRDTDVAATTTSTSIAWDNVSVNVSKFDYTGSVLGTLEQATMGFTDTLPTSTPLSTLYVQGGGGVGAYLRFTDEIVEEIRSLKFKIDETGVEVGKDIFINQAVMRIAIDDPTVAGLDGSMTRIGSYLNPKRRLPIPDYQYVSELNENLSRQLEAQQYGTTATPYMLPYNGYLNRSNAYYELDITSYIQQIAKVDEQDPDHMFISPSIFLGPEAYGLVGAGQSVLKGFGSDRPISIRITYTIIEG